MSYLNNEIISPFSSLPYYPSSFLHSSSKQVTKNSKEKPNIFQVTEKLEEKRTKKELLTTIIPTETPTPTPIPSTTITSTIPLSSTELIEMSSTTVLNNVTTKPSLQYDSVPLKIEMKMQQINEEAKRNQNPSEYFENSLKFETQRPCLDFDPCKHGKCMLNETGEFKCQCDIGYMGPFCDLIRHPCDFRPCENGICEIVGDLYYKCLCKPKYTGVNCHIGKNFFLNFFKCNPAYSCDPKGIIEMI